jgi:hypothetical protein
MADLIPSVRPAFAWQSPESQVPRAAVRATTESRPRESPEAKLTLRVYNYAKLDPQSLGQSEKVATATFKNVGVELFWVDCPLSPAQFKTYPECQSEMGTNDLVLRILPRHMAKKFETSGEPLGFAQSCPENEPACQLSVFYYRVDELARNGYRADLILGHVIAHEVTHVLIGPGHSEGGIMRGQWSRSDLQRISSGLSLDFTGNQSSQLRSAVLGRTVRR